MGGFQKFPVPRYLWSDSWLVNRRWKYHTFNILVPSLLLSYLIMRHSETNVHRNLQEKYYVDPSHHDAPKQLVL